MPFDAPSITGYNANPPEDNGSQTASNEISWQKHLDKIGGPLKTALEVLITELTATFNELFGVLMAPAGTILVCGNGTAPTGWTKGSTHNNKALRLVTGTPSTGGSTAFTSVFASRTIALANLPSVNLSLASLTGSVGTSITNGTSVVRGTISNTQDGTGSSKDALANGSGSAATLSLASGAVTFGGTLPLGGSGTVIDFAVQYVDVVLITKD